jgi:hypothetical protein
MTLRQGDTVLAGEGSGAIDLANSKRFVYVMSNSSCFVS